MTDAYDLVAVPVDELCAEARRLRSSTLVTYSPKVFVPLTKLCRDVCHYCTFAHPPRRGERAYMSEDEVLAVARAGAAAGCREALFTLGDKPELRYRAARDELAALGCETTLEYLARCAGLVLEETGLLPHLNPGVMSREDVRTLREVSASQGLMLETTAARRSERGGPHFGAPDKLPAARLATIEAAGLEHVPFTTGLLIGIGETRAERIEALVAIRDLHRAHGHIQEVIVQNFRAKPGTRMAGHPEPPLAELLWTVAAARVILGPAMHMQCPPNLSYDEFPRLLDAGIDDWGGVSPVTIDHVNPEAPWPELERLRAATEERGLVLAPRLCGLSRGRGRRRPLVRARGGGRGAGGRATPPASRVKPTAGRRRGADVLVASGASAPRRSGRPLRGARRRGGRATSSTRPTRPRCSPLAAATSSPCTPPPTDCAPRPAATPCRTSSRGT